jgi:tetratricopeptide (TPR) repeat protein
MVRAGLVALAALMAMPATARAEVRQLQPASEAASAAFRSDNYDRALVLLNAEIAACNSEKDDSSNCLVLMLMRAHAASRGGELEQGETYAREALAAARRHLGPDKVDIALFLDALAVVLERRGRFAEAEVPAREAVAISRKSMMSSDPDLISRLIRLGTLIDYQWRHAEAEPYLRDAVAGADAALRQREPEIVATSYNSLAVNLSHQRRWAEAETFLRRSLEIATQSLPAGHPGVLTAYGNLAANLASQGKAEGAALMYRQIIFLLERTPGASQVALAGAYNNMAALMRSQRLFPEAELAYRTALTIAAASLPAGHVFIVRTRGNLAACLSAQRKYLEAAQVLEPSLAAWSRYPASNAERITGYARMGATLLMLNRDVPRSRALFRDAADGALARMREGGEYTARVEADLRDSRWVFKGQVAAAWRLASR